MDHGIKAIESAEPNLLYYVLTGSRAYGIHTKNSDYDYRGVFINTPEEIYGLNVRESQEYSGDIILHSLRKFVKLAMGANPNILELLFLSDDCILYTHPVFKIILDNRDLFLSKKVKHTYGGYAISQLKRNKHKSTHGTMRKKYISGNPKDPVDSKFAGHTIRLMLAGINILQTGQLTPKLTGKDLLLIKLIRYGLFFRSGTHFYNYTMRLNDKLEKEYNTSTLQHYPDIRKINNLLIKAHIEYYEKR